MEIFEEFLKKKNKYKCKRTGICCRSATSVKPWEKLIKAKDNQYLRDFFNLFVTYGRTDEYKKIFPNAYINCISIVKDRKDISIDDVYFYYCRFFKEPGICQIYEDRPDLCRNYPESPFDAIDSECGFYKWSIDCKKAYIQLKYELEMLKRIEFSDYNFYIVSFSTSWIF